MPVVSQIDFGRVDAEGDKNLLKYFIDTGVVARVSAGTKYLVVGRKGSGKTAIHKYLQSQMDPEYVALDFSDYPWEVHKQIREQGLPPESAYAASWRFMLLVEFTRYVQTWGVNGDDKAATELLSSIYGNSTPTFWETVVDKLKRLRRLELPSLEGGGAFELDERPVGAALATSASQWARSLQSFVEKHYNKYPATLGLDRLDDGWDASDESKGILVGVLKAARELNMKLGRPNKPPPVVVCLRSDILDELVFNDKNKMSSDTERLEWTPEGLIDVIEARIAASLEVPRKDSWWGVFSGAEMRQRAKSSSYIVSRSMGRPRDIVAFCIECRDVALAEHHLERIETADIYEAEVAYSRHIYDELVDEMHKQMPHVKDLLQALREVGKTKFTLGAWHPVVQNRALSATMEESKTLLKQLFELGVVGVLRKGGKKGGSAYQYVYTDRLVEANFDEEVMVHPSLKKHLSLVEPQRTQEEGGSSDESED